MRVRKGRAEANPAMRRILIVDDQFLIVEYLRIWVETYGYEVCGDAASASLALEMAASLKPDIVLMDVSLAAGGDGVECARQILGIHPCAIIFITGADGEATMERVADLNPAGVVAKPVDPEELRKALTAAG